MSPQNTAPVSPSLAATWLALLAPYRVAVRQERVFVRLVHLSIACLLGLGRRTITQLLVAIGHGDHDWTAWYRLFSRERVDVDLLQATLLGQIVNVLPPTGPMVAAVDATQLPRTSLRMPGCGVTVNPRGFKWRRPLHLAQRFVGISLLLPRSDRGDSRAIPLRWQLLRTGRTTSMGDAPVRTERQGAGELIAWLRSHLDALGRTDQPLLVLGDGAYSTAPVLADLPAGVSVLARCARNRALFAVPTYRPHGPGRQPRYGPRGWTPQGTLHQAVAWRTVTVTVRGRTIPVTATVTGPWLIQGAPFQPLALLVVRGIDRGRGVTRRQRAPQFFLVTVQMTQEDAWDLPLPLADLLAWAWQRWEVEVMHRELKSSLGLGEQQAFSSQGAATVVAWVVWVYALLVLAAYTTWGYAPPPGRDRGCWWRPRRWSLGRALQQLRTDLWRLGEFHPGWTRSPDAWTEMTTWTATHLPAVLGCRRV